MDGLTPPGSALGSSSPEPTAASPSPTEMNPDDLRAEMGRLHRQATDSGAMRAYVNYAERMEALIIEYHRQRLSQTFPQASQTDARRVVVYDLRQSPKGADIALMQMDSHQNVVKQIIWDWAEMKAYLVL
jgi:DNA-binding GntR family transcriptional regulator